MSIALLLKSSNVRLSPALVNAVRAEIPIELGKREVLFASQIITYSFGFNRKGGMFFSEVEFTNFHPDNSYGRLSALWSSIYSASGIPFDGVGSA